MTPVGAPLPVEGSALVNSATVKAKEHNGHTSGGDHQQRGDTGDGDAPCDPFPSGGAQAGLLNSKQGLASD